MVKKLTDLFSSLKKKINGDSNKNKENQIGKQAELTNCVVSKDQKRVTGWKIPPGGGLRGGGNPIPNTGTAIVPTKAKLSEISNQEFNEWLKLQEGKSQRYVYESGLEMFCIEFTLRKFLLFIENFKKEYKSEKQKSQRRLMIACDGGGKHGNEPPKDYVPEEFSSGQKCIICYTECYTIKDLRSHACNFHSDHISKQWSKDALENAMFVTEFLG